MESFEADLRAPPVDADEGSDVFTTAVTFHFGRIGMPVLAEFTVPEPRTIVMRIVKGDAAGSVVETHATPLGPGPDGRPRTAVIEAVIASSDRAGFQQSLRFAPLKSDVAPLLREAAERGQVGGEVYTGPWHNLGTVQQLEQLNAPLSLRPASIQ